MFNKYVRNLLVWALILVVVLYLVLPLYNSRSTSSDVIAYSTFVSEAQQGHIDQVTIGDEAVSGQMRTGRSFRTYVPKGDTSYLDILRAHGDALGAQSKRLLKGADQRFVFGDIVGGVADVAAQRDQRRSVFRGDHHADARMPGIAPAAAVEVEDQALIFHRGANDFE